MVKSAVSSTGCHGRAGCTPITSAAPWARSSSSTSGANQRRVAELEGVASRRQRGQRPGQPVVVAREALGKLPQHRPELRAPASGATAA